MTKQIMEENSMENNSLEGAIERINSKKDLADHYLNQRSPENAKRLIQSAEMEAEGNRLEFNPAVIDDIKARAKHIEGYKHYEQGLVSIDFANYVRKESKELADMARNNGMHELMAASELFLEAGEIYESIIERDLDHSEDLIKNLENLYNTQASGCAKMANELHDRGTESLNLFNERPKEGLIEQGLVDYERAIDNCDDIEDVFKNAAKYRIQINTVDIDQWSDLSKKIREVFPFWANLLPKPLNDAYIESLEYGV